MPPSIRWAMVGTLMLLGLTGCMGDANGASEPRGQITRPADIVLPLDNSDSVEAFDVADDFLLSWFFRDDIDRALEEVHPDLRESWRALLDDTEISRNCSLLQVEGGMPDQGGGVTARYAFDGCQVTPPGDKTAVYVDLTMTRVDDRYWVNRVEFLR
ncbi:hypothetical protein BH20CHL1_BH20CHL1_01760 [soil metagenome]